MSKKWRGNTFRHAWDTVILLKSAYFKHFEHFADFEKFKTTNFAAKHCENVWNWSQRHDFHHRWEINCMGIPWGTPEIQWFCLNQLKTAYFKHFEHFAAIEKFKTTHFAANHCEHVWNWSQQHDFHRRWEKNWMRIPWGTPEIQWFCLKQLKTACFKHFPAIEIFEKIKFVQTTVNMCLTGHNNMAFTTVEQKIAWQYLEAYLRYSNFA